MEKKDVIEILKDWLNDEFPGEEIENVHVYVSPRDLESRVEEEQQTAHNEQD